jgi:hypothetical protein
MHLYVYETESGSFHSGPKLPKGATCHGRFANGELAHTHAMQLKRDYLSPLNWADGTPLTIPERVYLGVWRPDVYNELRERSRALQVHHTASNAQVHA